MKTSTSIVSLSFLLFFYFITLASSHRCSTHQSTALMAFKHSLFWTNQTSYADVICIQKLGIHYKPLELNWSTSTDCCTWNCITCNQSTGDVTHIDISCGKLQGTINSNSTLFDLPYLSTLILANNYLDGDIDTKSFAKLKTLKILLLSHNNFRGKWDLGDLISSLPNLIGLSLSSSGLSVVTDKPALYVNSGFYWLELSSCNISMFPRYLRALKSLYYLDISNNTITHLPELEMPNLRWLIMASNMIQGQLPSYVCNMRNLVFIDISSNRFGGVIPQCFSNLSSLTTLVAKSNMFHGTFPEPILTMSRFVSLDLSDNSFSAMIPVSIGRLKSLIYLNLSHNSFSGQIPYTIGDLGRMVSLDMSRNELTGEIPKHLNDLRYLRSFNVSENHLVGHIPQGGVIGMVDEESFTGNSELCEDMSKREPVDEDKGKSTTRPAFVWYLPVIALVLGCWIYVGQIKLKRD